MTALWSEPHRLPGPQACCDPGYARAASPTPEPGEVAITQRELLLEMREEIRGRKAVVDAIARDQAAGVERRAAMQRSADSIHGRLDSNVRDLDRMRA